jgi:hypothetical protein
MSPEQAALEIKAAAYAAASAVGIREAVRLLKAAADELDRTQWSGPNNR